MRKLASNPPLSDPPLSDPLPADVPRLGSRRQAVLRTLRESPEALGVTEVAQTTDLHPNTARFHLDALVKDGLAERTVETRTSPGRPRVLYRARTETTDQRSYALLAEILAGQAAIADDAREAAEATGRTWGRRLVEPPAAGGTDPAASVDALHRVFADIGFRPETTTTAGVTSIRLHHCPFREVAARHRDVVCGVHLGIMQGVLDELGGAAVADSLEPFVAPRLCVARVRRAPDA